jgi:hypothetical protein
MLDKMKPCVNCKHCYTVTPIHGAENKYMCRRKQAVRFDVVTGQDIHFGPLLDCRTERLFNNTSYGFTADTTFHCGQEGLFFQPKDEQGESYGLF